MEDVLEVYQRRYEDNEVLVCLDETSKQQSLPSATTGGERDAPAASGPAWGGGLLRLRIRAQRDALLPRLISGEICVDSL